MPFTQAIWFFQIVSSTCTTEERVGGRKEKPYVAEERQKRFMKVKKEVQVQDAAVERAVRRCRLNTSG